MDLIQALILGALQGVTEFLPISSSGHLVLGEYFLGLNVASLKTFDVAVHVGTLLAIIIYFWKDIIGLFKSFFGIKSEYDNLVGYIILGTIPAVIVGFTLEDIIDASFRNVASVAMWMLIVAVFFVLGEYVHNKYWAKKKVKILEMGVVRVLIIGCAQALALIPGVSRSGSTIVAGLFSGIEREQAARFSFLLGTPAILGAGILTFLSLTEGELGVTFAPLLVGFTASFLAGLLSVWFLMKFLKKHSLIVFAVYLAVLGSGVLIS